MAHLEDVQVHLIHEEFDTFGTENHTGKNDDEDNGVDITVDGTGPSYTGTLQSFILKDNSDMEPAIFRENECKLHVFMPK